MSSKIVLWVVIVTVFLFSGWQVYQLLGKTSESRDEEVLAASTTKTLEERVASLENRIFVLERNTGLVKPKSTGNTWQKISGSDFTLDTSLYGSSVEVFWEGWLDNGKGSVRIYDDTNHRVVDNSELSIDSGVRSSFYSKSLSIWRGQNDYYLEGRNPWGEMVLSSPRLRVVAR